MLEEKTSQQSSCQTSLCAARLPTWRNLSVGLELRACGTKGVTQAIKVAHFRLAYPRETQEMLLDAHSKAFSYFDGVSKRMVYDNLKTVVDTIFVGKERQLNRRFLTLANHYLFNPVACTPESGWEKGHVENQVGNVREWLFTPTPKFQDFDELNAWLASRCQELAGRKHPQQTDKTIAECFAEEQFLLMPIKATRVAARSPFSELGFAGFV